MTTADPHLHTHDHNFLGSTHDDNARRTLWVVALTTVMMVGEIVAGTVFGSMALLADGFHMATHAGALAVAAGAYAFARRYATDPRFSFGTGKVGDLAGFASALVLGIVAIGIAVESVMRLLRPEAVDFGPAATVAVIGLAVNVVSAILLSGGHHHGPGHGHGHEHHHDDDHHVGHGHAAHKDNNLRAAYMHVLADALTSVLAILALLAGLFLGWSWLDPAMGIVGAIVIARWSWSLMRDTAAVLLDTTDAHLSEEVRDCIEGPGDARIVDLHVWRVGPEAYAAIVSVSGNVVADVVRARLVPVHELAHITVECRTSA
ncbi:MULTISPECIES: CDF family Co(II)/Ni(II) efflux transporter DmeF [Brevundimonas]|jgi:cation diffusion facilitator family transporter|uniref:CDF family Co(II)/Ni(II) efflux transporter DmeF n=1 Tax=Brevundimonas sp. TaxID=1871086 RepID=UPI0025BD5A42|nr:CDF family Co(II)/Ni(II) efflux transporter DmeF [Brevundimonas sp.]MCG2663830.1 CDF family Co(II)/Ni(II) efflux transporter DmeF [Brevundimonas sp.]